MDELEDDNPPRKKVKVDEATNPIIEAQLTSTLTSEANETAVNPPQQSELTRPSTVNMDGNLSLRTAIAEAENEQMQKELEVGIEVFVSQDAGFQGILKRRYHDFLVYEIMPNGKIARLDDPKMLQPPKAATLQTELKKPVNASNQIKDHRHDNRPVTDSVVSAVDASITNGKGQSQPLKPGGVNDEVDPEVQMILDIAKGDAEENKISNSLDLTRQSLDLLKRFFDLDQIKKLAIMFKDVSSIGKDKPSHQSVESKSIDNKEDRTNAHQIIRSVFHGKIESAHKDGNTLSCNIAANSGPGKGRSDDRRKKSGNSQSDWNKLGGDYMHFTLYKENRDAGDILGYLSSRLNVRNQKIFDTAGNKDKRAVTCQRVSAYRVAADRFLNLNNIINQARVGDCSYSKNKLSLGDLAGNEFIITLRDCAVRIPGSSFTTVVPAEIHQSIEQGLRHLREKGFINYFGMQRFGSFATRTDIVGRYIINGDFKAAVDTIIEFSTHALDAAEEEDGDEKVSRDDKKRAQAIHWFRNGTKDINTILDTLPRRFTSEHAIVSYLGKSKNSQNPYYRGALEAIPRNHRSLYPHAYQSFIWNLAATHRWSLAPGKLLVGDLVLAHRAPVANARFQTTKYDTQGDPIFEPGNYNDRSSLHDQYEGKAAYALTEEDIRSDHYSIFDIVLPQPGFDVIYPSFMLEFYKSTMAKHGNIDPENMRRSWRDASLPGAYRKLVGRPLENWSFEQVWYEDEEAKIVLTDLERLETKKQQPANGFASSAATAPVSGIHLADDIGRGPRLAIVLKFQLPSSTYATMALRELMKPGPVEFKPEFSSGRVMGEKTS